MDRCENPYCNKAVPSFLLTEINGKKLCDGCKESHENKVNKGAGF